MCVRGFAVYVLVCVIGHVLFRFSLLVLHETRNGTGIYEHVFVHITGTSDYVRKRVNHAIISTMMCVWCVCALRENPCN